MSHRKLFLQRLFRVTLNITLLLGFTGCGPASSSHDFLNSEALSESRTTIEQERAANFKPAPMPEASYTQDNIDIREWVSDVASAFQFHNHSYNDYELPTNIKWQDVLTHYNEQMEYAGWANYFTEENRAFYLWQDPTSSITQYTVMVFEPATSVDQPSHLTLVYSFVGSEDSNLILAGSYDTGFIVEQDSLSFENYTDQFPQGNMKIDDVQEVFGNDVCIRFEDEQCVPIPNAELWIEQMVNLSSQGHCVGMTVLSGLRFAGLYDIPQYSGQSTYDFPRENEVLRKINRDWALQVAYEVTGAQVDGSPRKIISELLKTDELVDIGIYTADGGHSLLGYGVEEKGGGIFWIRVYDGNNPGVLNYVEVDVNANTWAYSPDGLDPDVDANAWRGDASTETLMFIPVSAYSQGLTCPFCFRGNSTASLDRVGDGYLPAALEAARKAMPGYTMVSLAAGGNSDLQATTTTGMRVGVADNQIVNELPSARVVRLRGNDSGIILLMPPDVDFSLQADVELDATNSRSSLVVLGQGLSFGAFNLSSQDVSMGYNQTTNQVTYASSGDSAPIFKMVTQQQDGEANMFTISGGSIPEGGEISFALGSGDGSFIIKGTGLGDLMSFIMAIARITTTGDSIFATDRLTLEAGAAAALDMAGWSGEGPIRVGFDFDGDFTVDRTYTLPDQMLASILDNLGTAGNILDGTGTFGVYMNTTERNAFLNTLGNLGLTGSELGTVVMGFNDSFGLTTTQLGQLAQQWGLSGSDLTGFTSGMYLPEQQTAALLALPPLPPLYTPPSTGTSSTADDTGDDGEEQEDEDEEESTGTAPPASPVSYASCGDYIWNDVNSDGVQDAGEAGIAGVTLTIYRDENTDGVVDGGDTVIGTATTGANGAYDFNTLTAGVYLVDVTTPPAGMALVSGALPHQVTLAAGQDYNSADFGYVSTTGNVSGYIEVGCTGTDGISLYIQECDAGYNCGAALQTVVTSGGGYYTFTNLPQPGAGNFYNVIYDNPGGQTDKVLRWRGPAINSITIGGTVAGGDFDLKNFAMNTPASGATGVDHTAAIAFDWDDYSTCIAGHTVNSYSFNIDGDTISATSVDSLGSSEYNMADPVHFISATSGLYSNATYTWYANVVTSQGTAKPQTSSFTTFTPPPPPNDDFDNPVIVTLSGGTFSDSQETAGAGTAADDPNTCTGSAYNSVWYSFTAPSDGTIDIDTAGSGYDTVLSIWQGARGSLTSLICVDDVGGSLQSAITGFSVTSGQTYYILVSGYVADSLGTMYFDFQLTP